MKKILISLIIILMFGFFNINFIYSYNGESAGGGGGNSTDIPVAPGEAKWYWAETYNGANGLKISVYKKDGTLLRTNAFVNTTAEESKLKTQGVYVKQQETKRLLLTIEEGSWKKSESDYFQYLDYDDYINNGTYLDIVSILKEVDEETLLKKLGIAQGYTEEEIKDMVLVIEPATTFYKKDPGSFYFGTYWEFMWMYNNLTDTRDFQDMFEEYFFDPNSADNIFSKNLKIKEDEISATKTPTIWDFLGTKFTGFRSKVTQEDSLGVAIVTMKDVTEGNDPTPETCKTEVTKGSCTVDYKIKEPTTQLCTLNNDKYKYQAITECGIVYCSQDISTDLDDFYKTFAPIIRSGGYFSMNPVKINITKTCYLKASSSDSSCNNWHTMITEEDAGNVKLNLISSYDLIKDSEKSTFASECSSKSGSKCTKATITQHIEYVLSPTTNKFISIKDMAGTATDIGDDIKDIGGAHLTTPITFASGTHNYSIDFTGTPLYKAKNRLTEESITLADDSYILNYSYTENLNDSDFSYSCSYTAKNPNGCECEDECCDNDCKPIPCDCDPDVEPCGFPNVVYRPINLNEGFPGEEGTGRNPGSNWAGNVLDSNGNPILKPNGQPYTKEEYYINYNRGYDDYEVYRSDPLYVIELDYDRMKAIRAYNDAKNHDYNDVTLNCNNGETCISNFLRGNVTGFNINLIDSGTCKTINHSTFDSCVGRIGA